MGQICCKCGKKEEEERIVEGFCLTCYAEEFPLILSLPEKEFNLTTCKLCGDLNYHGKWLEISADPMPVIHEFLKEFIKKVKKVKGTEVVQVTGPEVPALDIASKQTLTIVFKGTPKEAVPPYKQTLEIPMVINLGVCNRCAKYTRGYFESIVQIRADRRKILEDEQIKISELIEQKKQESLSSDRMAYIAKAVDQLRGGVDFYVGSDHFAKNLAEFLGEQLAASVEVARKLKTMKDGKPVYRTTYCVRLPYFEIGDVVEYQKSIFQVERIELGRVVLFDLGKQDNKTLSRRDSRPENISVVKKSDQLQKYIIMSIQPKSVALMNASTFETMDVDPQFLLEGHNEGEEILMVELDGGVFECKNFS